MDNMLILHSRCDQNVLSKSSLSTVNRSSQCSQDVITGFQVPLPPVTRNWRKSARGVDNGLDSVQREVSTPFWPTWMASGVVALQTSMCLMSWSRVLLSGPNPFPRMVWCLLFCLVPISPRLHQISILIALLGCHLLSSCRPTWIFQPPLRHYRHPSHRFPSFSLDPKHHVPLLPYPVQSD